MRIFRIIEIRSYFYKSFSYWLRPVSHGISIIDSSWFFFLWPALFRDFVLFISSLCWSCYDIHHEFISYWYRGALRFMCREIGQIKAARCTLLRWIIYICFFHDIVWCTCHNTPSIITVTLHDHHGASIHWHSTYRSTELVEADNKAKSKTPCHWISPPPLIEHKWYGKLLHVTTSSK